MAAMKMMMIVAVAMAVITAAMGGEVYNVGDHFGWTNIGHVDYKTWASTKEFHVGDTIVFQYNKIFHDVARVSYTDFKTCNTSTPYTTFTSGNDSFPIKYPGHYFFICTQPNHCNSGQKVDIRVPFPGSHAAPQPATTPAPRQPLPFPYPQPFVPSPSPVSVPVSVPVPIPSPVPSPVIETPPMPPQAPQAPEVSQSPAPSVTKESPEPSPPAAPAVAPSGKKSKGCQLGFEVMNWVAMMVVSFYLVGFGF
ncbi:hypothetical protein SSX86_022141 [Deinandra increscens subsp. villosa]|uniref:Phytocyanin domain-containing protein n=1 Tax=Deinandra increscens subsp. villosa TaxID=3103831 RepID=A0AAP0CJS8_9ASTR